MVDAPFRRLRGNGDGWSGARRRAGARSLSSPVAHAGARAGADRYPSARDHGHDRDASSSSGADASPRTGDCLVDAPGCRRLTATCCNDCRAEPRDPSDQAARAEEGRQSQYDPKGQAGGRGQASGPPPGGPAVTRHDAARGRHRARRARDCRHRLPGGVETAGRRVLEGLAQYRPCCQAAQPGYER